MPIETLDHYSVRTADVDATRAFYHDVIGLEPGPRPDFPFPGAWMYAGGRPIVHVIGVDPENPSGLGDYLGQRAASEDTGALDHVAFVASDIEAMRKHLAALRIDFRERKVPGMALRQIFVVDPNGVTIEINYRDAEG